MSEFIKIRFLFEGNFEIQGKSLHFKKGEVIVAPAADAAILIEGLCAVNSEETPAPPKKEKKVKHGR